MRMNKLVRVASDPMGISDKELAEALKASLPDDMAALKKVLLIPPDLSRAQSCAGKITNMYYHLLENVSDVYVMPALGTHMAMTQQECAKMFGDIPSNRFIEHNWRKDVVKVGLVPESFVTEISEGMVCQPIDVEISKHLLDPSYDLILSIGQVVPHEVVGMANYTKNILVGCGGNSIINASHMLGAMYGMERMMGKDHSPVRKLFDYAEDHFLKRIPLCYIFTVTTARNDTLYLHGLFIGRDRALFEQAIELSQMKNIVFTDKPLRKVVAYLEPEEFRSVWIGNKAIYRTRMAIADGGELIILAPGVERFGEDPEIDKLIRKYGYSGRANIIGYCSKYEDIQKNTCAAAHLIHGSTEGRFSVTYCPQYLNEEEVTGVGFLYLPYDDVIKKYDPGVLKDGYNILPNGEEIFYVSNPAIGLWADKKKFEEYVY